MPQSSLKQFTCMECGKQETFDETHLKLAKIRWVKLDVEFEDMYTREVLCKACWTTFLWRCKERKNAK